LSRYIREVRENAETIVVCDRDRPVAVLSPVADETDLDWERHKVEMQALAKRTRMSVRVPAKRPTDSDRKPIVASDGRVDVNTVTAMREERNY
jgi:antitoxin (DNA-binding transcriptional repressor) of toxin-antitoxin stability system